MRKGTTPGKCIFCEGAVIAYNDQGLPVCKNCKQKTFYAERCPICKMYLEELKGPYGVYYKCGKHGNWSPQRLSQLGMGGEKKNEM